MLHNKVSNRCGLAQATPTYMAPELFQAGGVYSSASDLWALGCVLYECASGRPPFVSPSFKTLAHLVLTTEPSLLPPGAVLASSGVQSSLAFLFKNMCPFLPNEAADLPLRHEAKLGLCACAAQGTEASMPLLGS